jgi:hypothetical protein
MLYGDAPSLAHSVIKLISSLATDEVTFPSKVLVSNNTKQLLKRTLTKDPKKRI